MQQDTRQALGVSLAVAVLLGLGAAGVALGIASRQASHNPRVWWALAWISFIGAAILVAVLLAGPVASIVRRHRDPEDLKQLARIRRNLGWVVNRRRGEESSREPSDRRAAPSPRAVLEVRDSADTVLVDPTVVAYGGPAFLAEDTDGMTMLGGRFVGHYGPGGHVEDSRPVETAALPYSLEAFIEDSRLLLRLTSKVEAEYEVRVVSVGGVGDPLPPWSIRWRNEQEARVPFDRGQSREAELVEIDARQAESEALGHEVEGATFAFFAGFVVRRAGFTPPLRNWDDLLTRKLRVELRVTASFGEPSTRVLLIGFGENLLPTVELGR
jgi:hypothetical protein